jgi:hypothetical protein
VLSGPQDSFFWTHIVMQFGHFSPAVRHAILAVSSLYEDFSSGNRITSQFAGKNHFALTHYNASMRHIQATQDENLTLLTCVLFLCIDVLLGNMESAARHCEYGSAILGSATSAPDWATDHLLPIFRRLNANPMPIKSSHRLHQQSLGSNASGDRTSRMPFTSLAQAEACLTNIRIQARGLGPLKAVIPEFDLVKKKAHCIEALDEWMASFTHLMMTNPSTSHAMSLIYLHTTYEMLRISVDVSTDDSETAFDRHIPSFQAIVTLAEGAAVLKPGLPQPKQRPPFILETGFLLPLSFTANKCRDLPTRLRALELMGELSAPKEGFVDTGTIYRMSRRVVELEHGMSLQDASQAARIQAVPLPDEEDRILFAAPDHQLYLVNTPEGQQVFYRTVKMFVRSPGGPRVARTERLDDDLAPPGVPALRSALT